MKLGQTLRHQSVPEVKENLQIDSVLQGSIANAIPGKSCILLDMQSPVNFLNVILVKTDLSAIDLGGRMLNDKYIFNNTINVRFFRYRGCLVFVIGRDDPYHFFKRTNHTNTFTFVNIFNGTNVNTRRDYEETHKFLNFYNYKNGRLISEIQPVY